MSSAGAAQELGLGLYHDPPDKAVVLCVDEKSQIQALGRPALCCR